MDENKTEQIDLEQNEREFADGVLSNHADMLIELTRITEKFVERMDAASLYIIVRATNMILNNAQCTMKQRLGIDPAKMN